MRPRRRVVRSARVLAEFLRTEASGGVVLLIATVAALVWANGPFADSYTSLLERHVAVELGPIHINEDLHGWVNDGLMTIFFFVVGLEIKRELVTGELHDPRAAALPAFAALGGMVVPAAIYAVLNAGSPGAGGWGIPMATDIAFVVGILAVLGPRAPTSLKLFLLTLAIVDDIGAIGAIAVFYTDDLLVSWLGWAGLAIGAIVVLRLVRVPWPLVYVVPGAAAWYATLESGIHPTIAGVAIGLITPALPVRGRSVLISLEHRLHPWSAFAIVPLFALGNAGVELSLPALSTAVGSRVFWGVVAGLVAGKIGGITLASWLAVRSGVGRLPGELDWRHVVGGSALAGVGFTVSLFITGLAFTDASLTDTAKVGILAASTAAALIGAFVLRTRHGSAELSPRAD